MASTLAREHSTAERQLEYEEASQTTQSAPLARRQIANLEKTSSELKDLNDSLTLASATKESSFRRKRRPVRLTEKPVQDLTAHDARVRISSAKNKKLGGRH